MTTQKWLQHWQRKNKQCHSQITCPFLLWYTTMESPGKLLCMSDNKDDDEQDGNNASGDDNNNGNKFTNGNSHSTNNPQPSKPSSLHGISTLMYCLLSLVTPHSHMARNNMTSHINNGNPIHTQGKQTILLSSFPSLSPPTHLNRITISQHFQLNPDQSTMAPPNIHCKNTQQATYRTEYDNATTYHNANNNSNGNTTNSLNLQPPAKYQHCLTTKLADSPHNDTADYSTLHNLTWPIYQWTQWHLDSFFDLAEMACEWNIDPGWSFFLSCTISLYGVWGRGHIKYQD